MKTPHKSIQTSLVLGSFLALATACGNFNTNPVADYQDLKDAKRVPLETKKQEQPPRPVNMPHLFVVLPDAGEQVLNFVEGQSTQYVLDSHATQDGVNYKLTAIGLPEGATFTPANDPQNPGAYILSWAPKAGTLRKTEKGHRDIRFTIRLDIAGVSDPNLAKLVEYENGTTAKYAMHLFATGQDAQIIGFKLGSDQIEQGGPDSVTVEVSDPNASESALPRLDVVDDKVVSSELGIVKIASKVKFDAPVLQDGKFVFKGLFDSSEVQMPKGKNEITGRFNVRVVSAAGGNPSPWQSIEIKILRKAEPAKSADQTNPAPADQSKKDQAPAATKKTDKKKTTPPTSKKGSKK